ncbi:hypothetical protein [Leuconostoc pseudomesenteroides]|uniref:hypothetical protein n=1 Tax=Leuconostoc pseudomesenteroides TaxID=33968 RepID=UPI00301BC491
MSLENNHDINITPKYDKNSTIMEYIPIYESSSSVATLPTYLTEKRIKNLEKFNEILSSKINGIKDQLKKINFENDSLVEVVETIYEEVEKTRMQEKRAMFAQAFVNSMILSQSSALSEEKEFINLLTITPPSYLKEILTLKNSNDGITSLNNSGALNFLNAYGIASSSTSAPGMVYGSVSVSYKFKITEKGLRFINFISTPIHNKENKS